MRKYQYGIATGLRNVYAAKVIQDDRTGCAYEKPFLLFDTITIKPAFEFSGSALDASDKRIRDDKELVGITYQINAAAIAPEKYAMLLGHRIDANGGVVTEDGDEAPEFALLYERTFDNGKSKFIVIYKGLFREPSDDAETRKKGAKTYQTPTIEYSAYRREDGKIRYEISEETPGYSTSAIEAWFEDVQEPVDENMPAPTEPEN